MIYYDHLFFLLVYSRSENNKPRRYSAMFLKNKAIFRPAEFES